MMTLRTTDELFAAAAAGTLGARGFGFALANQLESSLLDRGGGGKLVNLPEDTDTVITAGRVVTLTGGDVRLSGHIEELFDLLLCVVSPAGGQDALRFYCGPSGLALGEGHQLAFPRNKRSPKLERAAAELAAAWAEALQTIAPTDFLVEAESDFGRMVIGLERGVHLRSKTPTKQRRHRPRWDPAWLTEAERRARDDHATDADAAAALRDLHAACTVASFQPDADLESLNKRSIRAAAPLWSRALQWFETELAAVPASARSLPPALEHLARTVPYPPTEGLETSLGGRERLRRLGERIDAIEARRWAAHPW